jgi:hypothetical protein
MLSIIQRLSLLYAFPAVAAFLLLTNSAVSDEFIVPDLDTLGPLPIFDLVESPAAGIAQILGIQIRDNTLNDNFKTALGDVVKNISENLPQTKGGYLARVNLYYDEFGSPIIPGGQILTGVGPGVSPIDALAEDINRAKLTNPQPTYLRSGSYYIWLTKKDGRLVALATPHEFTTQLETVARKEAGRRQKLASIGMTGDPLSSSIRRAQYWQQFYERNKQIIDASARAKEIKETTAAFSKLQLEANEILKKYQQAVKDYDDAAGRAALFEHFMQVGDVIVKGAQLNEAMVSDKPAQTPQDPKQNQQLEKYKIEREYHSSEGKSLYMKLETSYDSMRRYDSTILRYATENGLELDLQNESQQDLTLPPNHFHDPDSK